MLLMVEGKQNLHSNNGFTIIEVVLVLAIAGLIFLIVFLALPGLQRSRRDTQRKSNIGNIVGSINDWSSNHGGFPPCNGNPFWVCVFNPTAPTSDLIVFKNQYMSNMKDPKTGSTYNLLFITGNNLANMPTFDIGDIVYGVGAQCDTSNQGKFTDASSGATSWGKTAVITKLESGYYCQNSTS